MPVAQPRFIDLPPLCVRAELGSINEEARTADLTFSTGAAVDRIDYWTGKRYSEVLAMKPENVRLDRLNAGAPLLDTHSAYSVSDMLGSVEPDTGRVQGGKGLVTVRFSRRDAVEGVWQDVKDRIVRNVSVGYRVYKFTETDGGDNKIPVRTAVDWEPYEISMVPMPADIGAQVRKGDKTSTNVCLIVPCVNASVDADRMRRLRLALARS